MLRSAGLLDLGTCRSPDPGFSAAKHEAMAAALQANGFIASP
jgi:hypothetical protein